MRKGRKMDFNKAQREALAALETDASVSAGAGSGKTRVLVERFCRLVRDDLAKPVEILTVTFTEKAAKEMKGRIVRQFGEWAKETGEVRFEQAARDVEAAYIGTIHGFASRLLRENAFGAGIDPRFSQVTETEAEILSERVVDSLMAKHFAAGTREYIDLALSIGRRNVAGAVKFLAGQTASLGQDIAELRIPTVETARLEALATQYRELGARIADGDLEGSPALERRLEEFKQLFPTVCDDMKEAIADLAVGEADYYGRFDWARYTRVSLAAKSFKGSVGGADFQAEFAIPIKEAAAEFAAAMLAPLGAYQTHCLVRVTADWREAYSEAKKARGALDFDDLLLAARALLIDPDGRPSYTARRYCDRFKYVMMDEFQDTNELQAALVRAVTPDARFFTVGDVKQSIYSFLHSDVEVFQKHHNAIAIGGEKITMDENYRSRPEIIDFVNSLFERIWAEDSDFDFEPLQASGAFHPDERRPVELLWVERPDGEAEVGRRREAAAISGRINQLLGRDGESAMTVTRQDHQGSGTRALHPGDIVILFSSTKNIKLYEEELARAGIDYYVVSGRGFYASREVQDIVNLLKVVDNPLDDIAMAGVLRSPFVGLDEDALYWLSQATSAGRHGRLYSALKRLDEIDELQVADQKRAATFWQTLSSLRAARSESRLVRFLERAVELTDYDLKLLAGREGKRRFANLRKLIDVARETSAAGIFEISEFIAHLERMRVVAEREGEAPTEAQESRVVQLMTIHKAKGLEAPVVFVADTSRGLSRGGRQSVFSFDKEAGVAAKVRHLLKNDLVETPAATAMKERSRARDIAESKRLFYVAATRAEERLIFVGSPGFNGRPLEKDSFAAVNSWSGWLERALEIDGPPEEDDLVIENGSFRLRLVAGAPLDSLLGVNGKEDQALVIDRADLEAGRAIAVTPGVIPDLAAMERVAQIGSTGPVDLTVTGVTDYLECPRKYRLKQLGVPEASRAARFKTKSAEAESTQVGQAPDAAALGTAVHDILAAVDWQAALPPQLEKLLSRQDEAVRASAESLTTGFIETDWPARFQGAERIMAEAPFSLELEDVHLYGRIDMLFQEDGGWVVVDYKTGSLDKGRGYEHQVRMYALAVAGALQEIPAQVALVAVGGGKDYVEEVDPRALKETEALLRETARGIRSKEFACRTGDWCADCGYQGGLCTGGTTAR